jgi:hypothetical protein
MSDNKSLKVGPEGSLIWAQPDESTADDVLVLNGRQVDGEDRLRRQKLVRAMSEVSRRGRRTALSRDAVAFCFKQSVVVQLPTTSTESEHPSQRLVVAVFNRGRADPEFIDAVVDRACAVATSMNRSLDPELAENCLRQALGVVSGARFRVFRDWFRSIFSPASWWRAWGRRRE